MSRAVILNRIITLMVVGLAAASQLFSAQAGALPNGLYGWTRVASGNGNFEFVSIDEADGHAEFLFALGNFGGGYEPRDLTYDPTNGHFYGNLRGGPADLFVDIDPIAQTATTHAYVGFPTLHFEGVEYLNGKGIVLSGADATGVINLLFVVDHLGIMQEASQPLAEIIDQDHLGANSFGGDLHVLDWNDPTNGFKINKWIGPFGASPTLSGVYNGNIIGDAVDLAINPATNTFYSGNFSQLLRYNINVNQLVVGNYNYPSQIWGIAYAAEIVVMPATSRLGLVALAVALALALLAASVFLRR